MTRRIMGVVLAVIAALAMPALAYEVAPMIYDLAPSGAGASTALRIRNDSDKPITIELVAEKRSFDEAGVESRVPADDDFVLFPPQAVISPNATQAVRVRYVGPADLAHSETYTVTVKQIPVQLPADARTGVQFLFNFSTLANIVPAGAKPEVQVTSLEPGAGGAHRLRLHNNGTKYANLAASTLIVGGAPVSAAAWGQSLKTAWLLPGKDRIIDLPASVAISGSASDARIATGRDAK